MLLSRYMPVLYMQYFLLLVDLFMNSFVELLRFENVILMVLYVIQDVCLIFAVIVVFLQFFNTYIFQAGLVGILINKFKTSIIVVFVYFALCLSLHIWGTTRRWLMPNMFMWDDPGYRALFVIQRTAAVFYYYFYKRTALKMGDPRFYQDSAWIRQEFEKRR